MGNGRGKRLSFGIQIFLFFLDVQRPLTLPLGESELVRSDVVIDLTAIRERIIPKFEIPFRTKSTLYQLFFEDLTTSSLLASVHLPSPSSSSLNCPSISLTSNPIQCSEQPSVHDDYIAQSTLPDGNSLMLHKQQARQQTPQNKWPQRHPIQQVKQLPMLKNTPQKHWNKVKKLPKQLAMPPEIFYRMPDLESMES